MRGAGMPVARDPPLTSDHWLGAAPRESLQPSNNRSHERNKSVPQADNPSYPAE